MHIIRRLRNMFGYKIRWAIDGIGVGSEPSSRKALKTVKDEGVEVILNLCAECGNLHEEERQAGFIVYWLPIADGLVPDLEELDECMSWLTEQVDAGQKVLIHCRFGVGRSGTILGAYLLKRGLNIDQVTGKLDDMPAAPANRDQTKVLEDYARWLSRTPKG
jgi:hypothetical protein